METRQQSPLSPRRRRRWTLYKTAPQQPSSGILKKNAEPATLEPERQRTLEYYNIFSMRYGEPTAPVHRGEIHTPVISD
jgi:hypothetical protein